MCKVKKGRDFAFEFIGQKKIKITILLLPFSQEFCHESFKIIKGI
jgi:hypothetical protein